MNQRVESGGKTGVTHSTGYGITQVVPHGRPATDVVPSVVGEHIPHIARARTTSQVYAAGVGEDCVVNNKLRLKHKYGDAESTFHFDPENEQKANLAIRLVGAKRRRTVNLSPEQKQALADRLARARDARNTLALV